MHQNLHFLRPPSERQDGTQALWLGDDLFLDGIREEPSDQVIQAIKITLLFRTDQRLAALPFGGSQSRLFIGTVRRLVVCSRGCCQHRNQLAKYERETLHGEAPTFAVSL